MNRLAVLACLTCSCQGKSQQDRPAEPPPSTGSATPVDVASVGQRRDATAWVGEALRAAIADLDGDGVNEIVLVDAAKLRVVDAQGKPRASVDVPGGIQVVVAADLDRDGKAEVITGWGQTREHMKSVTRIVVYRLAGDNLVAEPVALPAAARHDVTAIVPMPGGTEPAFLFAYFKTKYDVQSVRATGGSPWRFEDVASFPTGTSYARGDLDGDGAPELVVGRIYGDQRASDGDAFVLAADGTRTPIPTTRGSRDVAIADTDGDGRAEVFLSDGWHQDYGKKARARLSWARSAGGKLTVELVEEMPGQFSAGKLVPADVDGDGKADVISMGSAYVRVFNRHDNRWRALTIAREARDVAAGDLDGVAGAEVLVLGKRSEVISLKSAVWL